VVLFEEEIKRGQKAAKLAALDRIELSEQLAARTQEARDIETRFTRMAEFSPAGLFIANSMGQITYCNDTWYEIAGIQKDPECADNWIDYVKESDQDYVRGLWERLVEQMIPITAEFRFKSQWRDDDNNKSDTWVLFSAYPEKSSDDTQSKSVFGNITNISTQKWAQGFQKRKMEEAVELKRRQENFIDITSHEMRNPLSAILQCADEVWASLGEINLTRTPAVDREAIENSLDAAKTIILCAQHQKRIVDDVLTFSKLGSHMLIITPVDAQPLTIVQRALKMFEGETQSVGIDMKLHVHDSFKELAIDWVKLDPQRVVQVLINLTTNAIKFTSNADGIRGSIYVTMAASLTRPSAQSNPRVQYVRSQTKVNEDLIMGPDWGDGEEVYIQFAVEDTGPGLTAEEKKILFNRFAQASPKTHVQYGGSGLGLFISRELTELQGGEIGVASEAGHGSTFAFYVHARRSTEPQNTELAIPALLKSVESKGRRSEKGSTSTKNERKNITVLIVEVSSAVPLSLAYTDN
jgi:PAS domain S-box-containing protein